MDRTGQLWTTTKSGSSSYLVVGREEESVAATGEKLFAWKVQVFTAGQYMRTMLCPEGEKPWEQFPNLRRIG